MDKIKGALINALKSIGSWLIAIPICLLLIILSIGYFIFFVPFDIIRYYKSPYYKNSKKKYVFFRTSTDTVKLYNYIAKNSLPIEYVNNEDFEYFIKDGQVFLLDWSSEALDEDNGELGFSVDRESGDVSFVSMKELLSEEISQLKEEHKALPAKFLILNDDFTDADLFEKAKDCPYIHCAHSIEDFADIIPDCKWEDIVERLYDQYLDAFAGEVIEVIYSKDKSMRYVITESEKGLFWYGLEAIYQFDEDEWKYIRKSDKALPAMWEAHPDCNYNSFFSSKDDALREINAEPYYKQYF